MLTMIKRLWSHASLLLQGENLNRKRWRTKHELRVAIVTWVERAHRRSRRQARLGRLISIEYKTVLNLAVSLVA